MVMRQTTRRQDPGRKGTGWEERWPTHGTPSERLSVPLGSRGRWETKADGKQARDG